MLGRGHCLEQGKGFNSISTTLIVLVALNLFSWNGILTGCRCHLSKCTLNCMIGISLTRYFLISSVVLWIYIYTEVLKLLEMAEEGHRVSLNIYDLSQGLARQLSTTFLGKAIEGIWHTGVVVYGNEYFFGGGIQHAPVGTTPYGTPIRVVDLGVTHVPKDVFEVYLQEISPRYTADTYSLLTHNCNNFSNEVAQFLVGASIPDYILQLPNEVMNSPMGALILPMIQNLETTLKAGAVPQVPQFRPPSSVQPSQSTESAAKPSDAKEASKAGNPSEQVTKCEESKAQNTKDTASPRAVAGDPLGSARSKMQEEITAEFSAIMASGTLRASEAAALATRRVMQRYGNVAMQQS